MPPSWLRRARPWTPRPPASLPPRMRRVRDVRGHAGRPCSASLLRWCSPSALPGSCAPSRPRFRRAKPKSPQHPQRTPPWPIRLPKAPRRKRRGRRLPLRQRPLHRRHRWPRRPSPAHPHRLRQNPLKRRLLHRRRQKLAAHASQNRSQNLSPIPPSQRCHPRRQQRRPHLRHRLPTRHLLPHPHRLRSAPCGRTVLQQQRPVQPTPNRPRHWIASTSRRASALPPTALHPASCAAATMRA